MSYNSIISIFGKVLSGFLIILNMFRVAFAYFQVVLGSSEANNCHTDPVVWIKVSILLIS